MCFESVGLQYWGNNRRLTDPLSFNFKTGTITIDKQGGKKLNNKEHGFKGKA